MKINQMFAAFLTLSVVVAYASQAGAAAFTLKNLNFATAVPPPPAGVTTFEQRWNQSYNWILTSGVDDGANGIPDGTDTIFMDRTGQPGATRLSNEGMPNHSIAKITAIAGPGEDMTLKQGANLTIGDLEILPSVNTFVIREERDQPLTISGVISGSGDLEITRSGVFASSGVNRPDPSTGEDEVILFTGTSPNTYTGNLSLTNSNNGSQVQGPQPAYFVADKVGAFGQADSLTLESTGATSSGGTLSSLQAELQFTINTMGGEGAIDDDATEVYIGLKGLFNVDEGVNEVIGSGNLFIDLTGSGTFTTVADGVYDSSEAWIIGLGTITVGAAPVGAVPEPTTIALWSLLGIGLVTFRRYRRR